MSPLNVLLRVLLCIGLILDGSGHAGAAMGAQSGRAQLATTQGMPAAACDGHSEATAPPGAEHASIGAATPSKDRAPTCCQSSTCKCRCDMPPAAAMAVPFAFGAMVPHGVLASPFETGRRPPARARLNRPPIR